MIGLFYPYHLSWLFYIFGYSTFIFLWTCCSSSSHICPGADHLLFLARLSGDMVCWWVFAIDDGLLLDEWEMLVKWLMLWLSSGFWFICWLDWIIWSFGLCWLVLETCRTVIAVVVAVVVSVPLIRGFCDGVRGVRDIITSPTCSWCTFNP